MPARKTRRRAVLTRDRILRAALSVLDAEGLDAVSMRRVGEVLGVEAMSLYNHVPSKAAILDGLFEVVLMELPAERRTSSWRGWLRERAISLRAALLAHPNALPIFSNRPAVTPASISHVESVLERLRGAGFSAPDALRALQVLTAFVVGHTMAAHGPRRAGEESRPAYAALPETAYPRVHEAARLLSHHDVEEEFRLGLEWILDGLEGRLLRSRRRQVEAHRANRRARAR